MEIASRSVVFNLIDLSHTHTHSLCRLFVGLLPLLKFLMLNEKSQSCNLFIILESWYWWECVVIWIRLKEILGYYLSWWNIRCINIFMMDWPWQREHQYHYQICWINWECVWDNIPNSLREYLTRCFGEPTNRPTFVMSHEIFSQLERVVSNTTNSRSLISFKSYYLKSQI